jgi:RNA polymerase-binding transcription factor DksA
VNVEAVRERLLRERQGVLGEVERLRSELGVSIEDEIDEHGVESHLGDAATETFERERDVAVLDNAQDLLRQYDEALQRVDAGTYGRCVVCGRPIEPERLEALPYVAYCIEDARKREAG